MSTKITLASNLKTEDAVLKRLVEKTTDIMKLSVIQSLNSQMNTGGYKLNLQACKLSIPGAGNVKSVGAVFAERVSKLSAEKQKEIIKEFNSFSTFDVKLRDMAVVKGIDMKAAKYIPDQLNIKNEFSFINDSALRNSYKSITEKSIKQMEFEGLEGHISSGNINIILNKGFHFKIHEVKCVDETNPEFWSSDDIAFGAVTVDANGAESKIDEYKVGSFNDGTRKVFNPPYLLKTFNMDGLNYGENLPKTFIVTLILAEKDQGGFAKFISELYEAIKAELVTILAAVGVAVGAQIGAEVGGTLGLQ